MNSRKSHREQRCARNISRAAALTLSRGYRSATRFTGIALLVALTVGCAGQRVQQEAIEARQAEMEAEVQTLAEQAREAELARQQAERETRQLREELERVEREREAQVRAREAAEREAAERARQAAQLQREQRAAEQARVARAQEERIQAMERELLEAEAAVQRRQQANTRLTEAVTATEEMLQMLASEQRKYDEVDEQGQTVEPLQESLIRELEERKNALIREAQALSH